MTKKTPEEIEREIKLQEMELQKLVLVDLKLPASALWFEPPTIVRYTMTRATFGLKHCLVNALSHQY